MQRQAILVLLNNSLGEIHFILPYLLRLKGESEVDLYFYFINSKIYRKALDDNFYYSQIANNGVIVKPNDLLYFLFKNRKRISLILKDTTPLTRQNIAIRIKHLCPYAKLVLFPHAYALLGYRQDVIRQGPTSPVEDTHVDKVLYAHSFDVATLAQRYAKEKLLFAGALGYTRYWSDIVGAYVRANRASLGVQVPPGQIVVLFTLRDVHRVYMSEDNFNYLFSSALVVLLKNPQFHVIIKPHPRQNTAKLNEFLERYDSNRYTLSYLNTFVLSHMSDINLSFWSSSVTDCLAMGVPTIEFHRFHESFGQTIQINGQLTSFYSYLGLTKSVTSQEELQQTLPVNRQDIKKLYEYQRQVLEKVFSEAEQGFANFRALFLEKRVSAVTSVSVTAGTYLYFFIKFIFRKFKPV